jgi:hypothetical protein
MKVEIFYDSHIIKTTINSEISIKDLILNIKQSISSIPSSQKFLLFNENYEILSENEKIVPLKNLTKPFQLFLIKEKEKEKENSKLKEKEKEKKEIEIEEMIMKITGANKKLQSNSKIQPPNIFESNPNLNRLFQLLQALEQRNIIIEENVNNNNNLPIEVNENYLNELKDMGFPEDRARQALIRSRNNMNRATEILLDDGE